MGVGCSADVVEDCLGWPEYSVFQAVGPLRQSWWSEEGLVLHCRMLQPAGPDLVVELELGFGSWEEGVGLDGGVHVGGEEAEVDFFEVKSWVDGEVRGWWQESLWF